MVQIFQALQVALPSKIKKCDLFRKVLMKMHHQDQFQLDLVQGLSVGFYLPGLQSGKNKVYN